MISKEDRALVAKFCRAYVKWLDRGAPEREPFWRWFGLCYNSGIFELDDIVGDILEDEGLDPDFPFNGGNEDMYKEEARDGIMHLNPERIAWVREHAVLDGENETL